jgi:uncharacterized membrane protein
MNNKTEEFWEKMHQAGLTKGKPPIAGTIESPWYVKVLLGFSGWLAAIFLLGCIGVGFEFVFKNSSAAFIIGTLMIVGSFAIMRIPKNEFVEHLALAGSMAGQALVVLAIFDVADNNEKVAWLLVCLLELPLAIIMPSFVHRVFSSFIAATAFSLTMTYSGLPYLGSAMVMLVAALCWLNEFGYAKHMKKIQAIGYGLVLALILIKGSALFGYRTIGWRTSQTPSELWTRPWLGEVLTAAVTLFAVWYLLKRYGRSISESLSITTLLATLILCAVSLKVQGITVGIVIMLLGFAGSNRVLLGLGILSLLFYISSYYYLLDATLLTKSLNLLVVGLVLLALRWLILAVLPVIKEVKHA